MQDAVVTASDILGTKVERQTFTEVSQHYRMAKEDLQQRMLRKNGFIDSDKLYFNYIDSTAWPFQAEIFDPRVNTAISEKSSRLIGNKPKGRFVAREDGDEVGAVILNELFNFQWDDVSRIGMPLLTKWALMDQQTRRYGTSFAVNTWHYEEKKGQAFFDGPDMKVIYARDALPDPSYDTVKYWFQYREWVTLPLLEQYNEVSRNKNAWKNLNLIRDAFIASAAGRGQSRSADYLIKAKSLRGIQDKLGQDQFFKPFQIIHELRRDRWITFAPTLGVIIRDVPNPYDHGEIPVVQLKYDPILDDLYGFPEVERIATLQRAINALLCQYIDAVNHDLYPPLMINPSGVRMQTIEFKPDAKWLMNRPGEDVVRMQTSTAATQTFQNTYALLIAAFNNALGESSAAFSTLNPLGQEKTATEVRETTSIRNSRDNYNQLMLGEALKKQAYFWMEMDKQFMFESPKGRMKVVRIVGREAINYFKSMGLHEFQKTPDGNIDPNGGPQYPVTLPNGQQVPQFEVSPSGQTGTILITKKDIDGMYDFIPDVESMEVASEQQVESKLNMVIQLLTNPEIVQEMAQQGKRPRMADIIVKLLESTRVIKNADQFFENIPQQEQDAKSQPHESVRTTINFKDAPPDAQAEILQQAGTPSQMLGGATNGQPNTGAPSPGGAGNVGGGSPPIPPGNPGLQIAPNLPGR